MKSFTSFRQEMCVAGFEQNVQELAGLLRQKQAKHEPKETDAVKFAFEMKSYHSADAVRLATHYSSNIENGLSDEIALDRLHRDGPNHVEPPKVLSSWTKFMIAMFSGFAPLLWIAILLAFISWQPLGPEFSYYYSLIIGVILVVVVILSSVFNFVQERHVLHILSSMTIRDHNPACIVVRSGTHYFIDVSQLVIGDIVVLETGSRVPADIRIVACDDLQVDTSLLTGEAMPKRLIADPQPDTVSYLEAANTVFLGSTVVQGSGRGMVIATGGRTQIAKITQECRTLPAPTAVQKELQCIIRVILACASIAVLIVVLFWVIYLRVVQPLYSSLSNLFVDLITLIVAIVPICLPLAISVGITLLAWRLSSRYQVLVKRLGNVLILGSMSLLACDKTGTLTQNKAAVSVIFSAINLKSEDDAEECKEHDIPHSKHIMDASYRIAALGNQAKLKLETTEVRQDDHLNNADLEQCGSFTSDVYSAIGSKSTDRALLDWVNHQTDITQMMSTYEVQTILPFCPIAKISASVVCDRATREATVMVKGAPECLVPQCTHIMNAWGVSLRMTDATRTELATLIQLEEERGSSIIVLAQRGPLPFDQFPPDYQYRVEPEPNFPLDGLTFVSCAAIVDPLAEDALETVRQLRAAGVLVLMITGDAAITAVAVAQEVGIIANETQMNKIHTVHTLHRRLGGAFENVESILVLGADVDMMTTLEWEFVFAHKEIVFARTTPDQKLAIVKECQRRNHVVGVMGDGVNDCPALAAADIGIAVNSGADVTREIAEVLLLNDSFFGVVHGVREGRLIFDNLRKAIAYLLAVSWAQLFPILATFFLGLPKPITAFNIILSSVMTDVFGALALMYESPEFGMMDRPPRDINVHRLVDARLIMYSLVYGSLEAAGAFFNYFAYFSRHGNTIVNELGQKEQLGYRPRELLFLWYKLAPNAFTYFPDEIITVWESVSSVYFVALVVAQMFHLLSIRRKVPYLFNHHLPGRRRTTSAPEDGRYQLTMIALREFCCVTWVQWPVLYALAGSAAVSVFFMYISIFNKYCRTAAIPIPFWGLAVAWGLLWFALAEARKWIVALYPGSWVGRALVW